MSQPPTSKYPDMGEVTTLRLELCRERDRANAFEKALTTEVLKVAKVAIYQAMLDADSKAADTIGCMGVEVDDLKAENARLKAENENAWGSARTYSRLWIEAKENKERIEAEVERLRKAGDDLSEWLQNEVAGEVNCLDPVDIANAWEAAKEGKQP